ncbi:hypothetical protein evm_006699 [Chilo suppressalis]|nr:hypothetical protein evm_006699 [Chilo suppressalis]
MSINETDRVKHTQELMWTINLLFLFISVANNYGSTSDEEPVLYYYGIEESERGLPTCSGRVACAVVLQRYWRPDALVRLCRCGRRRRCDSRAPTDHRVELNNRAYFQFCLPVTDWPQCDADKTTLSIGADYDRINPDELEELHHQNREIAPPNITFNCQCRNPNYWRLKSNPDDTTGYRHYRCGSLPLCRTGELCGHVTTDLFALYQSCLCPKSHICVQNGGITYEAASELLYHGTVWNAYCRRVGDESSYEDY